MQCRALWFGIAFTLVIAGWQSSCSEEDSSASSNERDSEQDSAAAGDGDTDTDSDADTDSDTDADADTDSDTDTDGDTSTPHFDIDIKLASELSLNAPGTVGIVTWSLDVNSLVSANIEFGPDTSYGMSAPVDLSEPDYRTLLLGMKPDREYHFRVVANDGTTTYESPDRTVTTGPVTNMVNLDAFDVRNETARERGFIVTAFYQSGLSPDEQSKGGSIAFIVDADGEIVWWYRAAVASLGRARMSFDGKNMWMVNSGMAAGALERVTMDTLDSEVYDVGSSHDLTPVTGELMAYLDYSESDCDSIFEIDPSGTTAEVFESEGVISSSGCHANALRYSQTEDVYTFSDHHSDVLVVNRDGSVAWQLSDVVPGGSNNDWGGAQHGHHLLDNSLLIYANNGGTGSTATEYTLDGERIMHYDSGYSTGNLGDVQRLPGGNTLVTYSSANTIHEVTPAGELVLEIKTGKTVGYASWRPTLYGPPADISL